MTVSTTIEHNACLLCGGESLSLMCELDHRRIVRCEGAGCGMIFAARYSTDALATHYQDDYYSSKDDPRIAQWAKAYADVWQGNVKDIAKLCAEPKSLLDVGAGTGGFVDTFCQQFPETDIYAVESSGHAKDFLNDKAEVKLAVDTIGDLPELDGGFDVIVMLQTLEHVDDPLTYLKTIKALLSNKGCIYITVPNANSYLVKRDGPEKEGLCFSNATHLSFFTTTSLRAMLNKAGFTELTPIHRFGHGDQKGLLRNTLQYVTRCLSLSTELRYAAR